MLEKFSGGHPDGVESLLAGEIKFGTKYEDVREQIEGLRGEQKKALVLLVACDRIYGFFEDRGGVANGPRLARLVRDLASELELNKDGGPGDVSGKEARGYYDELVQMGVVDSVDELGAKNVFCTVWRVISEYVTADEGCALDEVLRGPTS